MISIIEDEEVRALIDRHEAIDVIERTYRAAAIGKADVSHPAALSLRGPAGAGTSFKIKGALLEDMNVAGFRLVGDTSSVGEHGSSYVFLLDAIRATPLALVSEQWLHRLRTAATGLVGCRALAPANPRTLSLIGTGRIAEEFIRIIHLGFPDLPIVIASRSSERARDAACRWRSLTTNPLSAVDTVPEAIRRGDIIITLSDADTCLFSAEDIKERALVCAMGGRHEFDVDVLNAASHLVVDEIDFVCTTGNGAYWIRSGQISRSTLERRVSATLGDVLLGRKNIDRDGIVLAIIQGMAVCDVALAKLAFDHKTAVNS
jgi:ornithine cyclodeaminase/alanine dehydrogenase-like protein (mu-crystallin family)